MPRDPIGASVVMLATRIVDDVKPEEILSSLPDSVARAVHALYPVVADLACPQRLWLVDQSLETLRASSPGENARFLAYAQCIEPDSRSPFPWMWTQLVDRLTRDLEDTHVKPRWGTFEPLLGPCEILFSTLAYAGNEGPMAGFAFQRAASQLGHEITLRDPRDCALETLNLALERLAELSPRRRREVLLACGAILSSDQDVTDEEAVMMRGISARLGGPALRILPGQEVLVGA